jgi:flagellar basal-body rod protein FlgB
LLLLYYGGVNSISDSAILAALGRQMATAVARQSTAASNLANLDTPGYKARGVFDDALATGLGSPAELARTSASHLSGPGGAPGVATTEVEGLATRRDGNNVQLDRELLTMSRAAGDFSAAQTALAAKFRLVRYAINEGR